MRDGPVETVISRRVTPILPFDRHDLYQESRRTPEWNIMDKVVDKIAALRVPGLVLLVAMAATGWAGAAAITAALAALGGPFGMLGGILVLGVLGLITRGLATYGFEAVFVATVDRLHSRGITTAEIRERLESYPISRELKLKILDHLSASRYS